MTVANAIRHKLARFGLGAVLVLEAGCNAEQPPFRTKPGGVPATGAFEDLKKDVKPPVVIKPNVAPDTVPPSPKTE